MSGASSIPSRGGLEQVLICRRGMAAHALNLLNEQVNPKAKL